MFLSKKFYNFFQNIVTKLLFENQLTYSKKHWLGSFIWPFVLIFAQHMQSNGNPYFYRFSCHHPLITQLTLDTKIFNICNMETFLIYRFVQKIFELLLFFYPNLKALQLELMHLLSIYYVGGTASFSSCQRSLIKTFQIEDMIALVTKITMIFSSDLLNGQKQLSKKPNILELLGKKVVQF